FVLFGGTGSACGVGGGPSGGLFPVDVDGGQVAAGLLGSFDGELVAGIELGVLDFFAGLEELGLAGALKVEDAVIAELERDGLVVHALERAAEVGVGLVGVGLGSFGLTAASGNGKGRA